MPQFKKSTDHDNYLISSEGFQDTLTCKISDHSLHAFSSKCPETSPDGLTDGDMPKNGHSWTNGPMYRWKEVISGFGQTIGRTDRQPVNIMPPAPKGGGIKRDPWLYMLTCNISFLSLFNSTDSLTDLLLYSLTFSVLSPEIALVVMKDLENIYYSFVRIPQPNSRGTVECVCHQTTCKTYSDPFQCA